MEACSRCGATFCESGMGHLRRLSEQPRCHHSTRCCLLIGLRARLECSSNSPPLRQHAQQRQLAARHLDEATFNQLLEDAIHRIARRADAVRKILLA